MAEPITSEQRENPFETPLSNNEINLIVNNIIAFFYFNLRFIKKEKMPTTFIAEATKRDIHFYFLNKDYRFIVTNFIFLTKNKT